MTGRERSTGAAAPRAPLGGGRSPAPSPPPAAGSSRRRRPRAPPGGAGRAARAGPGAASWWAPRDEAAPAQHGQQTAAAGAAPRLQPRRAGRAGLRLRARQLRHHPRPAARLPAAPAVLLPGRRGRPRVCCSSTDFTARLFEHVHHYSAACHHHFCSSSWWLSCLQGWRVGGHLHLSWCFVCHCILSNWDSVLPCTEAEKMP